MGCRVAEVVDIEENIWAPRYGLKGQLDATLRVALRREAAGGGRGGGGGGGGRGTQRALSDATNRAGVVHSAGGNGGGQQRWQQQQQPFKGRHSARAVMAGGPYVGGTAGADGLRGAEGRHSWSAGQQAGGKGAGLGAGGDGGAPAGPDEGEVLVVPFEFKSGRHHFTHRAQVGQGGCTLVVPWNLGGHGTRGGGE